MFSPLPPAFLLLLECFLASAAPASANIQPASMLGVLLRGNATINPVTLHPQFRPPSDGPAGPYNITITNTSTTLQIYIYRTLPLDSRALYPLFTRASKAITQHISDGNGPRYADHWLEKQDDPFVVAYQDALGGEAWFWAQSATDRRQHLTYRVVRDVVWGLREFVTGYEDRLYGASFEVTVGRWGVLGRGLVMPGEVPAGGRVEGRFLGQVEGFREVNMEAVVGVLEVGRWEGDGDGVGDGGVGF